MRLYSVKPLIGMALLLGALAAPARADETRPATPATLFHGLLTVRITAIVPDGVFVNGIPVDQLELVNAETVLDNLQVFELLMLIAENPQAQANQATLTEVLYGAGVFKGTQLAVGVQGGTVYFLDWDRR